MAPCHVQYISLHFLSFLMSKEYIRDGYFFQKSLFIQKLPPPAHILPQKPFNISLFVLV